MTHTSGIRVTRELIVSKMLENIRVKKALYSRGLVLINDSIYQKKPLNNLLDSIKVPSTDPFKGNIINTSA